MSIRRREVSSWTHELPPLIDRYLSTDNCPERLGEILGEIAIAAAAKRFRRRRLTGGSPFIEDAIGDAILRCLVACRSVDLDRSPGKIRSYLFSAAYWAILDRIKIEKDHSDHCVQESQMGLG